MNLLDIEIRAVEVERILDLRHKLLRIGLPRESAIFDGDDLLDTIHFAAIFEENVIGCATLLLNSFENAPAYQLRGMAVDATHQKNGVGRLLLEEIDRHAEMKGIILLWAHARTPALGFYRKLGWSAIGEEYVIPTAGPHFKIIKRLS